MSLPQNDVAAFSFYFLNHGPFNIMIKYPKRKEAEQVFRFVISNMPDCRLGRIKMICLNHPSKVMVIKPRILCYAGIYFSQYYK